MTGSGSRCSSWALRVFIEVFRGMPFLTQLFRLYSAARCSA